MSRIFAPEYSRMFRGSVLPLMGGLLSPEDEEWQIGGFDVEEVPSGTSVQVAVLQLQVTRLEAELSLVRKELQQQRNEIRDLRAMVQKGYSNAVDPIRAFDVHERVLKFTIATFGDVEFNPVTDPEIGTTTYAAKVRLTGTVEEMLAANNRWHQEIVAIAGDLAHNYCLSLEFE